jgi:hypothetical protein
MANQLKILYASSKKTGTAEQLNRFLQAVAPFENTIKIAAYRGAHCIQPVDWTLDALHDVFNFDHFSLEGDNIEIYYQQIKNFNPDLVISELEPYTSHIASLLHLPIWQVSSFLLWDGWDERHSIGLDTRYSSLMPVLKEHHEIQSMLATSDANFIYSHLGDLEQPPKIKSSFTFVRPYHFVGRPSIPCQHQVVGITHNNDRFLIRLLSAYDDVVLFSNTYSENFSSISLKNAADTAEYVCNFFNSSHFICRGEVEHLADAFYNGKYCAVMPDFEDRNCVVNAYLNQHFKLGSSLHSFKDRLPMNTTVPLPEYNPNIKLLHEKLLDF